MGIISWIVFGLIAGVLAKIIHPGKDPGGFIVTSLIGIAGAMIGGFISTSLGYGDVSGFDSQKHGHCHRRRVTPAFWLSKIERGRNPKASLKAI